MDSPPRIFTVSRIIGLVAIGLVVAGLAYLRFSPDGEVSVPEGAHAGQLTPEPCQYATEDGDYAADCGTLVVPENRGRSDSRLIALPVTRIRAQSEHPREPIFRLEGGPGLTNTRVISSRPSRFGARPPDTGRARSDSRTRASTSRATPCPSEWTTSRRPAGPSVTARSTSSARARAPVPR